MLAVLLLGIYVQLKTTPLTTNNIIMLDICFHKKRGPKVYVDSESSGHIAHLCRLIRSIVIDSSVSEIIESPEQTFNEQNFIMTQDR